MDGHVSADEAFDRLRKSGTPVSRATLYRTLSTLEECGILDTHDFGEGRKVYERAVGRPHHDHLFCLRCSRIIEFEEPKIEKLQDQVVARHGFTDVYHSLKIFGYCSSCSRAKRFRN